MYMKALVIIFGLESSSRVVWLTSGHSSAGLCRRVFQLGGGGAGGASPLPDRFSQRLVFYILGR